MIVTSTKKLYFYHVYKVTASKVSIFICILTFWITGTVLHPRWNLPGMCINWDVSGYYYYLPAIFIYHDVKALSFKDDIQEKYKPTPEFHQAYLHESGNYVFKYSSGQAIQYLPAFLFAHWYTSNFTDYPPDGFSFPYQVIVFIGSLFIATFGLIMLRKILLYYFSDLVVAVTIPAMVFGSNYLNYGAIDSLMTHNHVFLLYTLIIFSTIKLYSKPNFKWSIILGLCIGLATLTRPTEIITILIPLLWGVNIFSKSDLKNRLKFLTDHVKYILLAAATCIIIGSIQLIYWKYVTDKWFVYSYQEEGFNWFSAKINAFMFSYKSGWLTYSPFMIFSLIGFYFLYRSHKKLFPVTILHISLFIYIASAWWCWWYGGSLGQRTMVQAYPILAFPLAAFTDKMLKTRFWKWLSLGIGLLFIYLNIGFTYQAHAGGWLFVSQMTKAYYWKIVGQWDMVENDLKLLDTDEEYTGEMLSPKTILTRDSTYFLDEVKQFTPDISVELKNNDFDWIRASANFKIEGKEWTHWNMTQFILRFTNNGEKVKERMIRLHRLLDHNDSKVIFLDIKKPDKPFDRFDIVFWNANGRLSMEITNIEVQTFKEE